MDDLGGARRFVRIYQPGEVYRGWECHFSLDVPICGPIWSGPSVPARQTIVADPQVRQHIRAFVLFLLR
jgi:hypothetical protein